MRRVTASVMILIANFPPVSGIGAPSCRLPLRPSGFSTSRSPSMPTYRSSKFSRTMTKSMPSGRASGLRTPGMYFTGRRFAYVCLPQRRYCSAGVLPPVDPNHVVSHASMASRQTCAHLSPCCARPSSPDGSTSQSTSISIDLSTLTPLSTASGDASSPGITQTFFVMGRTPPPAPSPSTGRGFDPRQYPLSSLVCVLPDELQRPFRAPLLLVVGQRGSSAFEDRLLADRDRVFDQRLLFHRYE